MRSIDLFRSSSSAPSDTEEKQNRVEKAKCILAVVGTSQIQSMIEQSLESIGLELIFVTSGEAADEYLNKRSAAIVISEIDLPMMNGLSLTRRIKEDATLGDVPVLLISDSSEGPDKVMGMETGADDYITMPINPLDLRSRVMSLLSRTKNESNFEETPDLKEIDAQENMNEENVIGAGAQSIPVDELGLGEEDLIPTEKPELPQEAVTGQTDSVIIEEIEPVNDLSSGETDVPFTKETPVPAEALPGQPQSAIVEEADPFNNQEVSQSDNNVFIPADEKSEAPTEEEVDADRTDEAEESIESATPDPASTEGIENSITPSVIEHETEEPDVSGVKDPNTESMINDIFGNSVSSDVTQRNTQQSAPSMENPVPPPVPAGTENAVNSDHTPPSQATQPPIPTVAPVETVTQPESVAPPSVPANIQPQVQPQQNAQLIVQEPAAPLQQAQPPAPAQSIENTTIIPADHQPVQSQPAVPVPEPAQVVPSVPVEEEAVQKDMNEMALSDYDYEARVDDKEVYEATIADLNEFETGVITGGAIGFDKLIFDARKIVSSVQQSNYLHIKAIGRREAHDFPIHSINVSIFSVKLATGLNYENILLTELAISALLHDVGMLLLPKEIRHAKSKLSDEEMATLKTHPNIGSEYLVKALRTNPELTQFDFLPTVVLQEHERYDGTGYPNGTAGDEIHDYAKIISIIDMYEAVSHPSTYREEYLAYEALQKVVALKDTYFDVKFLRALVREISVFPLESLVRLNNGEIGQVIGLDGSHPMRPKLKIIYNADGEKYPEEKEIELAQSPFLYIETPITEDELLNKSEN